jgi:hypothetical protein
MKFAKFVLVGCLAVGIASCKKTQIAAITASNDDAAVILGNTLANNNYGLNALSTDVSLDAITFMTKNLSCGQSVTDSIIRKNPPGTAASYYYKVKYTNKLNCNANSQPDNLTNTVSYSGNFSGPRITITNTGSANYKIAGLTTSATSHVFNGTYESNGSYKFKTDTTNRGTAKILFTISNLVISKATNTVTGGTANVMITGTSTKKSTFTYNGTLTFNSASAASLSLNGIDYIIDLLTGEVKKK